MVIDVPNKLQLEADMLINFRSQDHVLLDSGKQSSDYSVTFVANRSRRTGIEVGLAHTPSRFRVWLKRDKEGY